MALIVVSVDLCQVVVWIFILLVLPFSYFITAITLSGTVLADIETARDYFAGACLQAPSLIF